MNFKLKSKNSQRIMIMNKVMLFICVFFIFTALACGKKAYKADNPNYVGHWLSC